jgi:hypothetical protein
MVALSASFNACMFSTYENVFKWSLTSSGKFLVKLMYLHMINALTRFLRKYIWKIKVPLKIIIFM